MSIFGIMRVKNEERWIERSIRSIQPICESVLILDDHSTDNTVEVSRACGARVITSPFTGLDEARDKDFLLEKLYDQQGTFGPGDWALLIDGDEELTAGAALPSQLTAPRPYALRILFLWDRPDQVRRDGVYRDFYRPSVFPLTPERELFTSTDAGGNLHCSSIPKCFWAKRAPRLDSVALLHYGYLDRDDRVRKYLWYTSIDPGNRAEDGYRHVVQGDLPEVPASARLRHAGPLELGELPCANSA